MSSTTIDIRKYFNQDLPAALAANAQAARAVNARYQFVIVGPGGGDWTVDLTAKGPTCKPGKSAADCTVTISDVNFRILCEKPEMHAMQLYMSAKLKVDGNTAIALKLGKILALVNLPKAATAAAPKAVAPAPAPASKPAAAPPPKPAVAPPSAAAPAPKAAANGGR
jgi:hypothetical protein